MTHSDVVYLPPPKRHPLATLVRRPVVWIWVLILAFTVWFSAYSIRLHEAHLTYKADLGQMDLAIWNTAHGRFVQEIKGDDRQHAPDRSRRADLPARLPPCIWVWDDVRALADPPGRGPGVGRLADLSAGAAEDRRVRRLRPPSAWRKKPVWFLPPRIC